MRVRSALALVLSTSTAALVASAVACGGGMDNLPPPPPPPPPAPTAPPIPQASAAPTTPPAPAAPAVALAPGAASPDPTAPLPTVKFMAPTAGQAIAADKSGDFAVKLDVKNWATATGSSHVHLILDNKPYKAIYDPKAPTKLSELAPGETLAEGHHVLVAFPSRANHESVKTAGALAVTEFYVGKKGTPAVDIKKPMLVYSRPKGAYKGEQANHVLVDFQLVNVQLAEGKEHVGIAVSGPGVDKELTAKAFKFGPPFYLDNLQNGSYTLKVELLGGDGNPLPGAWNSTTRQITIDHDAQPDPMPHDMGDAGAGTPPPAGANPDAGKPAAPAPTPKK